MSKSSVQLAKLPKDPRKRLQLLGQFLAEWGPAPEKVNITKETNAAKKRMGAMPPALKAYFELGLDAWLGTHSKKLKQLFGETWSWTSVAELEQDPDLGAYVIGTAGLNVLAYTIRPGRLSEPDTTVATYLSKQDDVGWPFGVLSETIIRECVLCVVANAPASRLHVLQGQKSDQSHPLEQKVKDLLPRIAVYEDRRGIVEIFASSDLLFVRRFPPRSKKCDLYLVGKTAADLKSFLKSDAPASGSDAVVQRKKPKKRPKLAKPKLRSVAELRAELKASLDKDIYARAADFITKSAVPCIRLLDAGPVSRAKVGATRIGGHPDLPASFTWPIDPSSPAEKNVLLFLGQLNFQELPTWRGSPFPKSGLLSLFVGRDGLQGSGCGFYFSTRKKLVRTKTPEDRIVSDFAGVLRPMRVAPYLSLSVPAYLTGFQQEIAKLCRGVEDFDEDYLSEELANTERSLLTEGTAGQIGGYAVTPVASDYHEQLACKQLKINGYVGARNSFDVSAIKSKRSRERVYERALNQQVVLSLDSSNSSGAMWADAGNLYLLQDSEQIKSRDFESLATFTYH